MLCSDATRPTCEISRGLYHSLAEAISIMSLFSVVDEPLVITSNI